MNAILHTTAFNNEQRTHVRGLVDHAREDQASPPLVLHVLDHSWPVLSGYSVRSRNLISAQRRLGYALKVLTSPLHNIDDASAENLSIDDVSYLRTPLTGSFRTHALRRRLPFAREYAVVDLLREKILKIVAQEKVELIHAHSPALCGLAALQAARRVGLPCVYEIRAFWEDAAADRSGTGINWRSGLTHRLETYVARRVDAVAAIAKPLLQDLQLRGIPPAKLFHTPNGVDADRLVPQPKDVNLAGELGLKDELVFGFFGSLYRYEGVSWLIPALARLRASGRKLQLLILGRGEDAAAIRATIRNTGAADYVRWIENVPHEQIARYYSIIDIAVYPRRSIRLTELVTPLKPLEAMAFGKPVLASGVGGIRELVEDNRTGLLFHAEDETDFIRQATRLIESPSLRSALAGQGREFMLRERDWKVLAQRYADIYRYAQSVHSKTSARQASAVNLSQ